MYIFQSIFNTLEMLSRESPKVLVYFPKTSTMPFQRVFNIVGAFSKTSLISFKRCQRGSNIGAIFKACSVPFEPCPEVPKYC
jgi:hypothetical protein